MTLLNSTITEDLRSVEAERQAINERARAQFNDAAFRADVAEAIGQEIYEGFKSEDLVSLFSDVEYLPLDGRLTFEEVRGLKAFWMERGGYIEESYLEKDIFEIEGDTIGFHVVESEDRIATRFSETAATLISLGSERLRAEVNRRVLTTYQAAIQPGNPSYVPVTGLDLTALNTALARVKDETPSGEVAIVGRSTMTQKIIDALTLNNTYAAYTPQTNEELLRRGNIGSYRGASVIELKNYRDDDGVSFFPGNELYIIGRGAGKTGYFGEIKGKESYEALNFIWHFLAKLTVGTAVIRPERVARIVDATVAP